jgi:hypothetical protein
MAWELSDEARYRTVEAERIVEMFLLHGWAFESRDLGHTEARRRAAAALDRLVVLGLPCRLTDAGARLFDPAEASNYVEWAARHLGERIWEDHFVATARRLVWEAFGARDRITETAPPAVLVGRCRYRLTVRRVFHLDDWAVGERVRLRLPGLLDDGAISELAMDAVGVVPEPISIARAPDRVEARISVPPERRAALSLAATFVAGPVGPGLGSQLTADEAELYIRPSEGLVRISDRVSALAARLAAGQADAESRVRRIWAFLLDEMTYGVVHYDQLDGARPLDLVLKQGWYDCELGSALFVALCRACGTPARVVKGYILQPEAPALHAWAEAWIEGQGWLPVDLAAWDLSVGGRDPAWRDYYFGHLGHRVAIQRPPRLFSGVGDVRLPPAWHMLTGPDGRGAVVEFRAVDTGAIIYREHIGVQRLATL